MGAGALEGRLLVVFLIRFFGRRRRVRFGAGRILGVVA
jgi:hypothetical protein